MPSVTSLPLPMRNRPICAVVVGLLCGFAFLIPPFVLAGDTPVRDVDKGDAKSTSTFTAVFPAERYLSHVAFLAHDMLKGRGTGSDGIDIAAGYIAGQFAAAGLLPGGVDGTYFQPFPMSMGGKIGEKTFLALAPISAEGSAGATAGTAGENASPDTGRAPADTPPATPADAAAADAGGHEALELRKDFIPFSFTGNGAFEGGLVFVGYGIINPEKNWDDYRDLDVKGKVVLMLRRQPASWGSANASAHAMFTTKVALAAERGAAAVLIVNQDPGHGGSDVLMPIGGVSTNSRIPAVHVKREAADRWLAKAGKPSLSDLQAKLDAGEQAGFAADPLQVKGHVELETTEARNVIGLLPGTGPHKDEYVVVGAHYDHLGENRAGINNGADDNASGTAGVIEVARNMAQAPYRDRSLLFMTFSAEELGLIGSRHFCEQPTVPMEHIAAMVNMDMIGRLSDDYANLLAIQGLGTGGGLADLVDRHAKSLGFYYLPDNSARGPSDHASFYEAGVPSLFFFTGLHPQYHRPADDAPLINGDGGARVAHLVFDIALDLVNAPERPAFQKVDQPANIFRRGPDPRKPPEPAADGSAPDAAAAAPADGAAQRPVLGIVPPDEEDSGPGWLVGGVMEGGGAQKSGIKPGDRILAINGIAITDFEAYGKALAGKKVGDHVEVEIQRGQEKLKVDVVLSGA